MKPTFIKENYYSTKIRKKLRLFEFNYSYNINNERHDVDKK